MFPIDYFRALFRKTDATESILDKLAKDDEKIDDLPRIRCPKCRWQPEKTSRWYCSDAPENFFNGCRTRWNTFDTRGVCPGCRHQWRETMCLVCHRISPHEDWYESKD